MNVFIQPLNLDLVVRCEDQEGLRHCYPDTLSCLCPALLSIPASQEPVSCPGSASRAPQDAQPWREGS